MLSLEQRRRIRAARFKAEAALVRRTRSYGYDDFVAAVRRVGVSAGDAVMVHGSFTPLNGFRESPTRMVAALREVVGSTGTLIMPSSPYSRTTAAYLDSGEVFDVRRSPSRMGILSEMFRRQNDAIRSLNPAHPVSVTGPDAAWFVAGHEACVHSCGPGSPFERLLERDGKVVCIGVGLQYVMFIHYLEHEVKGSLPFRLYDGPREVRVRDAERNEHTVRVSPFSSAARSAKRVNILYDAMDEAGHVSRTRVGNTDLTLIRASEALTATRELAARGKLFYDIGGQTTEKTRHGRRGELKHHLSRLRRYAALPLAAKQEGFRDRGRPLGEDPGIDRAMKLAVDWIGRAHDSNLRGDGGVAHSYSLIDGWGSSYPETTGYIVPTLIDWAHHADAPDASERAERILDWLVSIQLPDGAFQGGRIDAKKVVPVTFNTGQILLGLAAGVTEFGDRYRDAMRGAADWLVATQDPDGCWRKHPSPFAYAGEKTYETHVAWGLFEAARLDPGKPYADAGLANVRWALTNQRENGWFDSCCLTDPTKPLTHTLGYVLRGVIEAYRLTEDASLLAAARRTADGLRTVIDTEGFLPGRIFSDWSGAVDWACLTGSVQIAHCWLMMHEYTKDTAYRDAAKAANRYVRRTMTTTGPEDRVGAIKGSFPVSGGYLTYRYPNWAAKFFIDSNLLEKRSS